MIRPFTLILIGDVISAVGSQITKVALPLTAVLLLHANAWQIGLLAGSGALPGVLIGLVAGMVTDHVAKRLILVVTNVISGILLSLIPISHAIGWMAFDLLVVVNFTSGGLATLRLNALMATIPALVPADKLKAANGRYAALLSAATIAGPAMAGGLIAFASAPGAITADAVSYMVAATMMLRLPALRPAQAKHDPSSLQTKLAAGFQVTFGDRMIRKIMLVGIGLVFLGGAGAAIEPLFIVRQLAVKPAWYGLGIAAGGIGALLGALAAGRVAQRLALDKLLGWVIVVIAFDFLGISQLRGTPGLVAVLFGALMLVGNLAAALVNVAFATYLQERSGPELIGRVFGALTTVLGVSAPLGAVGGGLAASWTGLRPTLLAIALGYASLILLLSRSEASTVPGSRK